MSCDYNSVASVGVRSRDGLGGTSDGTRSDRSEGVHVRGLSVEWWVCRVDEDTDPDQWVTLLLRPAYYSAGSRFGVHTQLDLRSRFWVVGLTKGVETEV